MTLSLLEQPEKIRGLSLKRQTEQYLRSLWVIDPLHFSSVVCDALLRYARCLISFILARFVTAKLVLGGFLDPTLADKFNQFPDEVVVYGSSWGILISKSVCHFIAIKGLEIKHESVYNLPCIPSTIWWGRCLSAASMWKLYIHQNQYI